MDSRLPRTRSRERGMDRKYPLDGPHYQPAWHLRDEVRRLGRHDVARIRYREYFPYFRGIEQDRGGGPTVADRVERRARIGRVGERRRRRARSEDALHHERLDPGHIQCADRGCVQFRDAVERRLVLQDQSDIVAAGERYDAGGALTPELRQPL